MYANSVYIFTTQLKSLIYLLMLYLLNMIIIFR